MHPKCPDHGSRRIPYCEGCRAYRRHCEQTRKETVGVGRHPAWPVRDHLRSLTAAGMTFAAIARAAGTSAQNIMDIANHRRPSDTVYRQTAFAILGVQPVGLCPPAGHVPAYSTIRRVQALAALGYTTQQVGDRVGRHAEQVGAWQRSRFDYIAETSAAAVTAAYEQMWNKPARASYGRTCALAAAARNGWLPPSWWPGDSIDDPEADPVDPHTVIDEVAVERVLRGGVEPLSRAEVDHLRDVARRRGICDTVVRDLLRNARNNAGRRTFRPAPKDAEPDPAAVATVLAGSCAQLRDPADRRTVIHALWTAGVGDTAIARRIGGTPKSVAKVRRRAGWIRDGAEVAA